MRAVESFLLSDKKKKLSNSDNSTRPESFSREIIFDTIAVHRTDEGLITLTIRVSDIKIVEKYYNKLRWQHKITLN